MVLTVTLTLSILVVLEQDCFLSNSFGQLSSEKIVGNGELQKNVVYIGLKNIERNGVSDWFKNESARLVAIHLRKKIQY